MIFKYELPFVTFTIMVESLLVGRNFVTGIKPTKTLKSKKPKNLKKLLIT